MMGFTLRHGFVGVSFFYLFIIMFATTLVGCMGGEYNRSLPTAHLPYKVEGASDEAKMKIRANLQQNGIQVITVGQDYLISIPATALFAKESPHIQWTAYKTLNEVACYLKQFRKITVYVTAYSETCVSAERAKFLTYARANVVANYLWSQHIDSRFIFTRGLGSDKPIGTFKEKGDASPNSRIELTFRQAII